MREILTPYTYKRNVSFKPKIFSLQKLDLVCIFYGKLWINTVTRSRGKSTRKKIDILDRGPMMTLYCFLGHLFLLLFWKLHDIEEKSKNVKQINL